MVGYSPKGHKELDTTEQHHFLFSFHVHNFVIFVQYLYSLCEGKDHVFSVHHYFQYLTVPSIQWLLSKCYKNGPLALNFESALLTVLYRYVLPML